MQMLCVIMFSTFLYSNLFVLFVSLVREEGGMEVITFLFTILSVWICFIEAFSFTSLNKIITFFILFAQVDIYLGKSHIQNSICLYYI